MIFVLFTHNGDGELFQIGLVEKTERKAFFPGFLFLQPVIRYLLHFGKEGWHYFRRDNFKGEPFLFKFV